MRKFMFLFVLCGLMSGQAWGDNGIFRLTNGNTYVCGDEDGTFKFADGNKVQTLGPSWLDNDSRPSHRYYTCSRSPWNPAYDDHWNSSDPNWCSDTELKDVNMANIKVCIYVAGEQKECYPQIAGRTDGCLHIRCEDGYRLTGGKCVEESKGCPYMEETVAYGTRKKPADVDHCKKLHERDKFKNVDKIKSCYAECENTGKMQWYVDGCATDYEPGKPGSDDACVYVGGNNDNNNNSSVTCKYGNETLNPGQSKFSVDLEKCKKVYENLNKKNTDKIESCYAVCESSGAMRYLVLKCEGDYTPGETGTMDACVKVGGNNNNNRGGGNAVAGKCDPSVCKSEVCKECCKRPSSETFWDRTAQVCQCMNGGKFQKDGNTWSCKVDAGQVTTPGAGYKCDATLTAKFAGWRVQCASRTDILQSIAELELYCAGKPTEEVFLRLYDEVSVMARMCQQQQQDQQQQQEEQRRQEEHAKAEALRKSRRNISDAHGILVGMRETFKASVWKDEEGKFNTSRLVSDSIAGVVLGTVGGVVTSNIVKKNQVENGFEDIKCTVGGQTVADWGDEFRVGIQ